MNCPACDGRVVELGGVAVCDDCEWNENEHGYLDEVDKLRAELAGAAKSIETMLLADGWYLVGELSGDRY